MSEFRGYPGLHHYAPSFAARGGGCRLQTETRSSSAHVRRVLSLMPVAAAAARSAFPSMRLRFSSLTWPSVTTPSSRRGRRPQPGQLTGAGYPAEASPAPIEAGWAGTDGGQRERRILLPGSPFDRRLLPMTALPWDRGLRVSA
jgi:hypothetical protein